MTNLTNALTNEGLTVTKKDNEYFIKDFANNKIKMIQSDKDIQIFDRNGNSEFCNIEDFEHIKYATFSALESEEFSYSLYYVNQHLLDCETKQDEIFVNVRGFNDSVEVVDVIGAIEEKGRIYVGLEIITNDFPFGHIIHVNFMNTWDFVYKDEMVEIQDVLSNLISEQLKTDLGIQKTVLDDVKEWAEELAEEYDNGQIGALNDLMQGGIKSGIVSHLIYNGNIMDFYDEHYTEIDEVLKRDNKQMFDTIYGVWYVWEKVAYEYLTQLESE